MFFFVFYYFSLVQTQNEKAKEFFICLNTYKNDLQGKYLYADRQILMKLKYVVENKKSGSIFYAGLKKIYTNL